MEDRRAALERRIRMWLVVFVVCLVLSGLTAFPLVHELRWLDGMNLPGALGDWISRVREGLDATDATYPFVLYGTDWLAFAHLVIAVAFYGVYRDPVRNIWVVEFGMIACVGIDRAAVADIDAAVRGTGVTLGREIGVVIASAVAAARHIRTLPCSIPCESDTAAPECRRIPWICFPGVWLPEHGVRL